jgi:hypothetical protein
MHGQHPRLSLTTISLSLSFVIAMMIMWLHWEAFSTLFLSGRRGGEKNHYQHHQHRRFYHGKHYSVSKGGLFCFNRPERCLCITRYPRCLAFAFLYSTTTNTQHTNTYQKNAGTRCRSSCSLQPIALSLLHFFGM